MSDKPRDDEGFPLYFDRGDKHYFWVHEITNDGDPIYQGYDPSRTHTPGPDASGPTEPRYAMLGDGSLVPLKDYKK